ncbi:tRNA pseudouridine(13) synthase TruD [Chromatocurvus halotolerans]|uniref:tRNA pseudouridine synthase D n=1 Tax=Chromatocurvus halotolerans TaxID=1132028 RepID=A0A4R2L2F1_9GAMM|nr:tRNA pseudouridine(13) synthase TruD [Chromatocurvus halotolerans]TCO76738.1 tRNA pseudouridine13 synthase [Chromatocurvus halotolerans]
MAVSRLPEWPRAHGDALFAAALRTLPQDFQVTEQLGWEFSGDGEHDYLWVEKIGANTEWMSRQLAAHAGVAAKDVGYAGLKDRHAITWQWFSVPRWHAPDWNAFSAEGVRIVDVQRHLRKLRRGAHRANAFRILLRCDGPVDAAALEARLAVIREQGVPNYYGEQRFGRQGSNLQLADAWAAGKRLPRPKRSLAISTVRSFVFNQALAKRVREGTWNQLVAGDFANLDGTGSVFEVAEVDDTVRQRCAGMDVHPAIVLAGDGSGIEPVAWQLALERARVESGQRSLRLPVRELSRELTDEGVSLCFTLDRGAFATSVLREVCETRVMHPASEIRGDH